MFAKPEKFIVVVALVAAAFGCDKRSRTRNSAGSLDDTQEARPMGTANVYRFTGVEQSLADARRAVQEERWDDVIAATDALLRLQPGNTEAQSLNHQARLEAPNQQHFVDFMKAAGANEVGQAVKQYKQIAEGSLYRDKARVAYEKLRASYIDNQEGEARSLVRAGRCDEARRAARVAGDWFPDSRGRMEDAASGCRPARGEKEKETQTAALDRADEKPAPVQMSAPVPPVPLPSAPIAVSNDAMKAMPEPPKTVAAAPIATPPASASRTLASVEPPGPSTLAPPRNVPISEMETYRIGGEKTPKLSAGANMIAHRDGVKRITVAVKLCMSPQGVPTVVSLVKATEYADANEQILSAIHKWRFRPYLYNGQPVPVCSATLLNYQIE